MGQIYLHLLMLMALSSHSCAEAKTKVTVSCPENQRAFRASCYEFVDVQRSFFGAQGWCERRGGHLAFIPDEQTQYFLQNYLDSTRDIWFGAASPGFPNVKYSPAAEAVSAQATVTTPLSWLSGSYITYSNWMSTPEPGSACAHTLRDTDLQWEATKDCSTELPFVCQHEFGSSTACAGHDSRLQCGSGQVVMIDGAFYGRKSVHFCRTTDSTHATITPHQCGWMDVTASITARCRGHQVCLLAQLASSYDDLCPPLGSYLSVDYHCTDGLVLSVSAAAAVFSDISISVKWLLELQQGNLSCELTTGDGAVFYLNSSDRLDSSVLHKYTYAGTFVVAVECNLKDTHITAEEIIIIEEPVGEFGLLICYAGKQSFHMTKCNILYGEQFQIQMEVKAGTNVTYRLQSDEICLPSLSVVRGNVPQNITVTAEMVERLEPGCHQLTLYASNKVTLPEVSAHLQMCVLEEVAGLQASVLTESIDCQDSPGFTVAVSLERGAPVTLLFSLSGDNSSFSETRQMNTRRDIFHIQHPVKGSVRIQLSAWNVFSSLETHAFASCGSDSVFGGKKKRQIRQIPSLEIVSTPAASVTVRQDIVLSLADASTLTDPNMRYQWSCTNPCKCQGQFEGLTHTINQNCLPDPLAYDKYHFSVINRANNNVEKTQSICISFGLTKVQESTASLRCSQGCDPVESDEDVKIKLTCSGDCSNAKWYVEDIEDKSQWPSETRSCYTDAHTSPYTKEKDGGDNLKVKMQMISQAMANDQNINVVVMSEGSSGKRFYTDYIIQTASSTSSSTTAPAATNSDATTTTTTTTAATTTAATTTAATTTATTAATTTAATTTAATTPTTTTAATTTAATTTAATTTAITAATTTAATTTAATTTAATTTAAITTPNSATTTTSNSATTTTSTTTTATAASTTSNSATTAATTTSDSATTTTAATTTAATTTSNSAVTSTTSTTSTPDTAATTSTPNSAATTTSASSITTSNALTTTPASFTTTSSVTNTGAATTTSTTTTATAADTPSPQGNSLDQLMCTISPQSGTIFDAFQINCTTRESEIPCSDCQYCLKTQKDELLRCSEHKDLQFVFLPLGDNNADYNLVIRATAKSSSFAASTTITAQVIDPTDESNASIGDLTAAVDNVVAQLKENNALSGETVGQVFHSVSEKLNSQSDGANKEARRRLREQMLDIITSTIKQVPTRTPAEVEATARGLGALIQEGSELSSAAQEEASLLFENLSSSLLQMGVNNSEAIHSASSLIVAGASNILDYSSSKNVSDNLLAALTNTESALLAFKNVDEEPTIIQQGHISMMVSRVTPGNLHTASINIPNSSSPAFSLPKLPANMLPSHEPVDIRMQSLDKNPFSWNERGNISSTIGALSLTTKAGSSIPVKDLSEDIEIMLPSLAGHEVNTSFLDLGNFSTTVIELTSANSTLVLKMVPSYDPLPIKLFLGFMEYPTDQSYVAMTEMPHQGRTQEERYTWILEPEKLQGNIGVHYLVVRPIVGPGIKSINATLSITTITTACKFWDEAVLDWRTYGCRVGVQTTPLVTQCLCNHLTFFGSSFFVTPNLVDPSRTAELFASFAENPVVVCFVGALFVAYVVVVVWARRKDAKDATKVKITVLEDNNPVDEHRYLLSVSTGHRRGAATSSQVTITLLGTEGNSEPHHLSDPKKSVFERGAVDLFLLTTPFSLGDLQGIRLWHNNSGSHPDWYVGNIMVQDLQTEQKFHFLCNSWLAIDMADSSLDQVFQVSTEMDLKRFSNLFFMKTSKDFSDGHLWYSVISRPPSSTFTCVQRVSCCFSLLLCTMLTSIMFYGIPSDPSEQTMDLGHFEFTWQQFMIGVQSSLIMFPINILIVSIFRNTRPRETSCCRSKKEKHNILEQPSSSETNTSVSLEIVTKEIKRIAQSLSKALKSNEKSELQPGQHVDINDVLSTMEDFIKHTHKTGGDTPPSKTKSIPSLIESPEGSLGTSCASAVEGVQKKTDKTQYLYRQLCHIDKRLSQLEPSSFPNPHSHSRALLQVQGMKGFLEDQLCHPDPQTTLESNPTDGTDSDGSQDPVAVKKRACCHGGLPWWFIFFGWLLLIATSVVSGYFTMLYGLKFGRERSISWLVSMIVSFFQSILVIQPLKVISLAVFFALVLKNFDEEDYRNVALEGRDQNKGDFVHQHTIRKDERLYEPPPPGDIEKMRRTKILEKKAFAILVEILTYMGFLWMLLLVAYGQRDPNAFFLNQHIRTSFSKNISDSMSLGDVFTWANTCLLRNLFGVHSGFITDGNSKLVGNARLRQLRVQRSSCELDQSMIQFVPDCLAPYSWEVEDMGSYSPGWNQSLTDDNSTRSIPWTYHTETELRAHPVWGNMALYRGGGFVAELGPDFHNASSTLEYLFRNKWLDQYTRVIFVEFTVYNANVNLFCIVTLSFETTATGAFQFSSDLQSVRLYQSTGGLYIFVMAAEILYMLFILYYMFIQGKLLKQQRWAYFRSKRNLVELTIILLSWSAVAVFITRTLLGNRDMAYYQNHRDQFASFYETASTDLLFHYLIAVLVLLATIKLWHLFRLNPKMNMITATLQRAWSDICSFLVVIVILLVAYSIVCNLIYGWRRSSYRSFTTSLMTIISLQIGIFNYDEVLNGSPLLGGFLIGSCVIFVTFVVLNLLVSVILVAFNQEQICHKPSDEEEIVDLLLKKICSFFGMGYKNKNMAMSDVNEGNGFTLNNGRDICNNPSPDGNVLQKSENSVNP